jgi:hypothetical protein
LNVGLLLTAQDAERALRAATAFGGNAKALTQFTHRARAVADRIADLAIGYGTANANVHTCTLNE